ncbi:DUF4157 domain-containing protein [Streptomyces seoulensis]|uniref:DUF4157 domain-containing protein n=1 Tax=Streptomyces seoulensis TaxID=73044 RepID=A0A4V0ZZM1_STRSO|nr:DUF4157 domain-containing protein [Streptomyces seoulensis]
MPISQHTRGERESGKTGRRTPAAPEKATTRPGPGSLAGLQGAVGNAAVVRMVQRAAPETHRHGAGCGHEEEADVQRAAVEEAVQRAAVHDVLSGSGRPLDQPTRTEMEGRLGADLSDVRVHTGRAATDSAAQMGARAYTSGSHIVIGKGGGDRHTLAHELTHVIQQRNGPVSGTDTGQGYSVSDPSDRFERAAEANARKVMSGPAPGGQGRTGEGGGDPGASRPAAGAPVQRKLETVTTESATVSHYAPTKEDAPVLNDLGIKRPKVVTGSIDPTSTKGRPAARPSTHWTTPCPTRPPTARAARRTAAGRPTSAWAARLRLPRAGSFCPRPSIPRTTVPTPTTPRAADDNDDAMST